MTREQIDRILAEYDVVNEPSADVELRALGAAIFIEDAFGVRLTDVEIRTHLLGGIEGMRALVRSKVGVA